MKKMSKISLMVVSTAMVLGAGSLSAGTATKRSSVSPCTDKVASQPICTDKAASQPVDTDKVVSQPICTD